MNVLLNVVIAYLTINLAGGIYEVIRLRKEILEGVKKDIDNRVRKNKLESFDYELSWKVGCWAAVIITLLISTIVWAPVKVVLSDKK